MKTAPFYDMSPANIVDQAMPTPSIRMATLTALPVDAETARDIQIKLKLAKEARKQGRHADADYWLNRASASMEEFSQFQTGDWMSQPAGYGDTNSENTAVILVTLPTTAMLQAGM